MNTGRICPIGHNLPTSDIQPFHSDCGPLLVPYTDFNNSCVPGMPPQSLWEVVDYFRSIGWENSLFPGAFFFLTITSASCWCQNQSKGWHALSFPLNLMRFYWSVMAWGSRNTRCSSVVRDPRGSLSVLWSFFKYFFSPQQIVFYFFSVGWIMSSDLLNYGL